MLIPVYAETGSRSVGVGVSGLVGAPSPDSSPAPSPEAPGAVGEVTGDSGTGRPPSPEPSLGPGRRKYAHRNVPMLISTISKISGWLIAVSITGKVFVR